MRPLKLEYSYKLFNAVIIVEYCYYSNLEISAQSLRILLNSIVSVQVFEITLYSNSNWNYLLVNLNQTMFLL